MPSDQGMPGIIFSCNVVATHGFSSHNCVTKSELESGSKNYEF